MPSVNVHSSVFKNGLETGDLSALQKVPKADRHCHFDLSGRFNLFEKLVGRSLPKPAANFPDFQVFQDYILDVLDPILETKEGTKLAKLAAIISAYEDGVTQLEPSMDDGFSYHFGDDYQEMITFLSESLNKHHPNLDFRPELGLGRTENMRELEHIAAFNIATVKAHIGEFSTAEAVRQTVEELELDEVQHGIGAAQSPEVMAWLAREQIPLNICPTSNVKLGAVPNMKTHPIRVLADHGVIVTINTDDALIFGNTLSEEYLALYEAQVFSANELDLLRKRAIRKN